MTDEKLQEEIRKEEIRKIVRRALLSDNYGIEDEIDDIQAFVYRECKAAVRKYISGKKRTLNR